MQIIGIVSALLVIIIGFTERDQSMGFFDPVALTVICVGMLGALVLSSRPKDFIGTLVSLREILPFFARYSEESDRIEAERVKLEDLWVQGKKIEAANLAEASKYEEIRLMMDYIMSRADDAVLDNRFTALGHRCVDRWEPVVANWEQLAKLGPAFGMVGTLTGMILLFKDFGTGDSNIGASLSLALLSTLYGLVLGSGVAGPIGSFLSTLMNQRIQVLKRCHKTVKQLVKMG
ncbi:MotA/TolQ/ExbB proton channel family protein [Pseudobacteriovorax antillogorgiicola]|uniref:Flagellar motor component MotA n=1 Tax=Pseudobacteriovorax antillogorgiicola TaxID=1513793 RepID=A0A1Y6CKG9_9BACT|nr:MotA/TolQ/ExbB proton channel family protein [Pseudobacteriovorax antillogorgiicola]TCS45905.1 flagellar motor component MotA [Pseudobacteriovorax antillogorgiicola]SMF71108.1 Flagellar motor component MotA [Pseudobacteriovorax antillogorgiicola]